VRPNPSSSKILGLIALLPWCLFWACSSQPETTKTEEFVEEPLAGLDTNKVLITPEQELRFEKLVLIPFVENGLWGFKDTLDSVVVMPHYEAATTFSGGLSIVKTGEGFGLLNKAGEEVMPPKFAKIENCGCGIYAIRQSKGYALLNKLGKRIDKGRVTEVIPFGCQKGRIPVRRGKALGFIDATGKEVVQFNLVDAHPFYGGVAPVKRGGEHAWRIMGLDGKFVNDESYEELFPFIDGYAVGTQKNATGDLKYGVVDSTGKTIVPFQYARITGAFTGDYIACAAYDPYDMDSKGIKETANTWFFYDRQGNKAGETHYTVWDDFSEGLVVASKDYKFGFLDPTGKVVVPFQYDWACGFQNGLAWVGKNDKFGFIDQKGKVVIPLKYAPASDYVFMEKDGALVRDLETGERFYIDKNGKEFRQQP
jgi:hypothetical protein